MGVKRFGDWDKAKAKLVANPGARVALATGTTTQLAVHTTRFVTFGTDDR